MSQPNNGFTPLIERIRQDVRCGHKMGEASALRVLDVLDQLASEVMNLRRRIENMEQQK